MKIAREFVLVKRQCYNPQETSKGESIRMADRKEEIIRLQNQIIRQMTDANLRSIGEDLWGRHPLDKSPRENASPPPGYPAVPDVFGKDGREARQAAEETAEAAREPEDIEKLKEELHSYIGLTVVKAEVESLINLVKVNKLRKTHDLPTEELSLHMVFSGNPGTGKTMIARLMSRIYHSLGILEKGHLIEVDRGGLVAGYVGQTAIKTGEVIQKALGGVLFIDEAYALTTRGSQDYGQEAVETLLKAMEDKRDNLVVIVAGYVDLMNSFVHSNPGLESRFNRFLYFPDYSVDEMLAIFDMRCQKAGYRPEDSAREELKTILKEESEDNIGFGNARGVRNLFEQAVSRQANRLAGQDAVTRDELMLLKREDLLPPADQDNGEGVSE
ncbi:MAG: AAA family ATPase [Eubacteriales bacterium]|nr:AAA family ATPase [Eubacteriales bacterium]